MERNELHKKIYSKIDELPTLPDVIPRLLSLMDNANSNAADVTEAISRDPALTSKVLKVANSAYYGFPQGINDLDRAVALLGFNMVKSLALSMGVIGSMPSNQKSKNFSLKDLWLHSVAVATLMKEMGNKYGGQGNSEEFFIIGLLHDIGMIVLDQFFNDLFQQVYEEYTGLDKTEIYLAERKLIGFDHGEIGGILLKRWKFPDTISEPISLHHAESSEDSGSVGIAMLRVADAVSHTLDHGIEKDELGPSIRDEDREKLNLEEKDIKEIENMLQKEKEGIYAFFNAMF